MSNEDLTRYIIEKTAAIDALAKCAPRMAVLQGFGLKAPTASGLGLQIDAEVAADAGEIADAFMPATELHNITNHVWDAVIAISRVSHVSPETIKALRAFCDATDSAAAIVSGD